jgi:hypothetical protein
MKTIILSLLSFMCCISLCPAQSHKAERYKPNIIYLELGGNSPLFSVNFERIMQQNDSTFFSMRIGFGLIPLQHSGATEQTFPLELIWAKGKKHHLECGLGVTTVVGYSNLSARPLSFIPAPRVGYRYQPPNSHLIVRIGLAVLFTDNYNHSSSPVFQPAIAVGLAL